MRILQDSERGVIETLRALTKEKKVYVRYTCLLMFDDGLTYRQIARFLGIGEKTPQRAVDAFRRGGIDEVSVYKYVGNISSLTEEQEAILAQELTENLYVECKEIRQYILDQFGVDYTISGICKMLKRLGFVYKKPKVVPIKADIEAQREFAGQMTQIIEELVEDEVAYFLDGVHPTHNTGQCYGWIKKGADYEIPANSGRQRVNINGAMNAQNPEDVHVDYTESVNAQSTKRLIQKLLKKNKKKKRIYLISDNALYYKNKELAAWLHKQQKITWLFLPPYSPNLNLIERLWRLMKNKAINGFYYDTFSRFKEEIKYFFENIKQYKAELRSLMTLKFHFYNSAA